MKINQVVEKKEIIDFDKSNFQLIRAVLFTKTYIARELSRRLREKYSIPEDFTPRDWIDRLYKKHHKRFDYMLKTIDKGCDKESQKMLTDLNLSKIENLEIPEIKLISEGFDIDHTVIRDLVLYGFNLKFVPPRRIYYGSKGHPVEDYGIYIKVTGETSKKEIQKLLIQAKEKLPIYERLKQLIFNSKFERGKRKRIDLTKGDIKNVQIVELIEERIDKLVNEERKKLKDEYSGDEGPVAIAIEQVAGDILTAYLKNEACEKDECFDTLLPKNVKRINTIYYKTMRRFMLPTPKKLSSILKLISS